MADFNINTTQDQSTSAGGLERDNPAMTYVDFANTISNNATNQQRQALLVQQAMEQVKQQQLKTKQGQEAADLGVNPELKDVLTIPAAVAALKGAGIKKEQIDSFVESLGDQKTVSRMVVQDIILKKGGNLGLTMTGLKRGPRVVGEDGKWYETYEKRTVNNEGIPMTLRTDRFDAYNTPVFEREDPEAYATAKPQLSIDSPKLDIARMTGEAKETLARARVQQNEINNWIKLTEMVNPATQKGVSALAMSGKANQSADRAFGLLAADPQTMENIAAIQLDISRILTGGVPQLATIDEQEIFNPVRNLLNQALELITGARGEGIVTVKLEQQLFDVIKHIKDVDNEIIDKQLKVVEVAAKGIIKEDPERWERLKRLVEGTKDSKNEDLAYAKLYGPKKAKGTPSTPSKNTPTSAASVNTTKSGATWTVEE